MGSPVLRWVVPAALALGLAALLLWAPWRTPPGPEEERRLAEQLVKAGGGRSRDPRLQGLVEEVGRRVVADPARPVEFTVLATPEVGLYSLPDAHVLVTEGLLARLRSRAEIAAVLSHALAHLGAGHAARDSGYTADQEREADGLALDAMAQAGFDPRVMRPVLERLQPDLAATHPGGPDRWARLDEETRVMFPEGVPAGLER